MVIAHIVILIANLSFTFCQDNARMISNPFGLTALQFTSNGNHADKQ